MAHDADSAPPTTPSAPPVPPEDVEAAVLAPDLGRDNVYCVRCGYNLRGLEPDGRCPECGTHIERSLRGNMLLYSDSSYLESLSRGALLIMIANISAISAVLLVIIASIFVTIRTAGAGAPLQIVESIFSLVDIGLTAVGIVGYWFFSRPDPMYIGRNDGSTARKILRISVLVAGGLWMANAVLNLFPGSNAVINANIYLLVAQISLFVVWLVAICTQFFSMMLYILWLAPRIPSRATEKRCKLDLWLLPVLYVVGFPCVMLGPLITMIIYIVLLYQLRSLFQTVMHSQRMRFPDGPAPIIDAG